LTIQLSLYRLLRFASVQECEDLSKPALEILQQAQTADKDSAPKFKLLLGKQPKDVPLQECLVNIFNTIADMLNNDPLALGTTSSNNNHNNNNNGDAPQQQGTSSSSAENQDNTSEPVEEGTSSTVAPVPEAPVPATASSNSTPIKAVPLVTKDLLNDEWTTEHQAFNMFIQTFYTADCRLVKLLKLCEQGIVLSFLGELGDILIRDMNGHRTKDIRGTWELDVKKYADCYSFTHRRQEQCFLTTDVRDFLLFFVFIFVLIFVS